MDHGGEAARPTTMESAELGMAGAVQGGEANVGSSTFDSQHLGAAPAAAGRGEVPVAVLFLCLHHEPGHGVAYANTDESWRQRGPVDVGLRGLHLPHWGVVLVPDSYGYSSPLQPRPGAGHGAGHGEVFVVGVLAGGGVDTVYHNSAELARHLRGRGEVPVTLLHREPGPGVAYAYPDIGEFWRQLGPVDVALVGPQLPHAGVVPVHNSYFYSALQPRLGAGYGEVFVGLLPDDVAVVYRNSANFAQQTVLGDRNLGAGAYDGSGSGSGALAYDLGVAYDNTGMVDGYLRRLLAFIGIGVCCLAVNGLAACPDSPADAFHLFALLLGGLFLVILHVLRVSDDE